MTEPLADTGDPQGSVGTDGLARDAAAAPTPRMPPESDPEASADGGAGIVGSAREIWRDDKVEILAAILLSLATVLSAWGAYQATRWSGEQANGYARSAALRADSARHGTAASRQIQVDVQSFLAWSAAKAGSDERLATFLRDRFRPEFATAFDVWAQSAAKDAAGIPVGTPFDSGAYVLAEQKTADDLYAQADAALVLAQRDNQTGDDFVLTSVMFASVLFFAGIASRFRVPIVRWALIGLGGVVFVGGLIVEFSLPQNVGF
jgi:hypothetical protein